MTILRILLQLALHASASLGTRELCL